MDLLLAVVGCAVMYPDFPHFRTLRHTIVRVTTASFYAAEKGLFSYILTFAESLLMLGLMLILPPLFGGQIMIWWSTVIARILSAILALLLKRHVDRLPFDSGDVCSK